VTQHSPPGTAQKSGVSSIALDVPRKLGVPVRGVRLWCPAVVRTSMPKASIDEDDDPLRREHDVGRNPHSVDGQDRILSKP
jgi:hypothetical protein